MNETFPRPESEEALQKEAGRIKQSLELSVKEGRWWAIMVGFGESYLTAFGEFLEATLVQISLLTTLPQLIASIVQLAAFRVTILLATRKRVVVTTALLQSFTWPAIIAVTYHFRSVTPLIVLVVFYFICGAMILPAWTSWMGDLVPERYRGRYFGRRNRIAGFVSFVAVFGAGAVLDRLSLFSPFAGFAVLFSVAFVGRFISSMLLWKQYEPRVELKTPEAYSLLKFIRKLYRDDYGFFSFYIMMMMFAVYLAAPLFIILWLRILDFSYFQFMVLVSSASIASFITMTTWGRQADRFGNKIVLEVCSYLVASVPFLWYLVHYLPTWLAFPLGIALQFVSGFSWAGFNLSSGNFVYDMVTPENRLKFISYHTVLKGTAVFLGGMLGGFIAEIRLNIGWLPSGIFLVLLISGISRGMIALFFGRRIREVREVTHHPPLLRLVTVIPFQGLYLETMVGMNRTVRKFRERMRSIWSMSATGRRERNASDEQERIK